MQSTKDYYQILSLQDRRTRKTISAAELRQAYKQALLLHHPDKRNAQFATAKTEVPSVDDIAEAYKILADPALRAEYDRSFEFAEPENGDETHKSNTRHTGMETVDLEELEIKEDAGIWTRLCRCGSKPAFVVTEAELEKNVEYGELITGCKGCSLWLKVLFSVDD